MLEPPAQVHVWLQANTAGYVWKKCLSKERVLSSCCITFLHVCQAHLDVSNKFLAEPLCCCLICVSDFGKLAQDLACEVERRQDFLQQHAGLRPRPIHKA